MSAFSQGRRPSQMTHTFSQVPKAEIPRSSFDRSHGYKTTFDAGYLVPFLLDEALPGDTFNCRVSGFARLATPIFPIMDNLYMDTHFFSVPVRLLWSNWQRFNGEQSSPGDTTDFIIPTITSPAGGYPVNSLGDYMGLPTQGQIGVNTVTHSALFARAYNLIYNEWFRDENLIDGAPWTDGNGPDNPTDYILRRRGKRHDYFTSCLPWPQKGPGVSIPLGTTAPVTASPGSSPKFEFNGQTQVTNLFVGGSTSQVLTGGNNLSSSAQQLNWFETGLTADLTQATAATINSLREAFQMQRMFERDARGGTRYTEIIKAHFGVTSPDARLQRPEYLGGGSTNVNISPVPQTSGTAAAAGYTPTPQGNLAAVGTASLSGHGFTHSFTEHCIIVGIVSVRSDLTYQQGLNRMWSRSTRFDFYWPALSHIGEQAVLNKEIMVTGTPSSDDAVFGYQERYAEYRYKPSTITGLFKSTVGTSLDAWHVAQEFATVPQLNQEFIEENPPIDRVIAVENEPHFLFDSYIKMKCARPMPVYGVPGFIDHF